MSSLYNCYRFRKTFDRNFSAPHGVDPLWTEQRVQSLGSNRLNFGAIYVLGTQSIGHMGSVPDSSHLVNYAKVVQTSKSRS